MLGIEHCSQYVLLEDRPSAVFKWMQALEDPAVAFMVINPNDFFPDYEVELTDEQAKALSLDDPSESVMFTTITVDRDEGKVTTNLAGPIIVNLKTLQARQIIVQNEHYCTKHTVGEKTQAQTSRELAKAA